MVILQVCARWSGPLPCEFIGGGSARPRRPARGWRSGIARTFVVKGPRWCRGASGPPFRDAARWRLRHNDREGQGADNRSWHGRSLLEPAPPASTRAVLLAAARRKPEAPRQSLMWIADADARKRPQALIDAPEGNSSTGRPLRALRSAADPMATAILPSRAVTAGSSPVSSIRRNSRCWKYVAPWWSPAN